MPKPARKKTAKPGTGKRRAASKQEVRKTARPLAGGRRPPIKKPRAVKKAKMPRKRPTRKKAKAERRKQVRRKKAETPHPENIAKGTPERGES